MYNLSIEVDNQNVSSGNVEVEGTDFYGCGCRANGQCAEVLGYWENDVLTVLLSDEGCGSSAGQILNEGGIYDFEEVGSGSLNGTNSFGVSGNEVQAYAAYLLHEGDDVTISDRQSINATVRFVPVVEEIVPEDQETDLVIEEEGGLPTDGTEQEEVSSVQGPGLEPEEEAEAKVQEGADRGDVADDAGVPVAGENVDVSQVGQPEVSVEAGLAEKVETELEVSGSGAEEVLEVPAGGDSVDAEDEGDRADEEQLELVSQDESLGDRVEGDTLAGVLVDGETVDVSRIEQREEGPAGDSREEVGVTAAQELAPEVGKVLDVQEGLDGQEILEDRGDKADEERLELVSQDESLGDRVEGDTLAGVLVDGETVDVSQVGQPEVPVKAVLTEKVETELEVPGSGAEEVPGVQAGGDSVDAEDKADEEQRELTSSEESTGDEAEEEDEMLWLGRIGHLS